MKGLLKYWSAQFTSRGARFDPAMPYDDGTRLHIWGTTMSVDLEAGGALATAGLAAREIDKPGGRKRRDKEPKPTHCANCKSKLTGNYCWHCGQAAHVHRSLKHMFEETLHGVLHFDGKAWRTLPMLIFRPGALTRRYIDGQRVRYVSPLALFLFSAFLLFFVYSIVDAPVKSTANLTAAQRAEARAELVAAIETINRTIAQQSAAAQSADPAARSAAQADLAESKVELQVAESALAAFDSTAASPDAVAESGAKSKSANRNFDINTGNAELDAIIDEARGNPDLAAYKIKNTAYKFSFILVPISLPFLWLMFFWRPGVTMYDHTIFSLYSLSFMSLFFTAIALLQALPKAEEVGDSLSLAMPLHMFLQLKGTYGLGFFSALWRTLVLLISAGVVFVLFLLMVVAIAVT
jgi:hypothetical protein